MPGAVAGLIDEGASAVLATCDCQTEIQRFEKIPSTTSSSDDAGIVRLKVLSINGDALCLTPSKEWSLVFSKCASNVGNEQDFNLVNVDPTKTVSPVRGFKPPPSGERIQTMWSTWRTESEASEDVAFVPVGSTMAIQVNEGDADFFVAVAGSGDVETAALQCDVELAMKAGALGSSGIGEYEIELSTPGKYYIVSSDTEECLSGRRFEVVASYLSTSAVSPDEHHEKQDVPVESVPPQLPVVMTILVIVGSILGVLGVAVVAIVVLRARYGENRSSSRV